MAIYVMSDIHGQYEKYLKMLEKIGFSDDDILYVLGDVIDRGPEPVKVLTDMSSRHNIFPIMGNHELMAVEVLSDILKEITEESISKLSESFMGKILEWNLNGGSVTLEKFKELSPEKRKELFDYICDFSLIETVDVKDRAFVLVHSTLGNFSKVKKLRQYTPFELTSIRADYDKQLFDDPDIYVVSGHTPTPMINGKAEIYYSHNNIDIDCGATYGGKLACLRLDDMQEFYV